MLKRLNLANWGLLKIIISNRDRKFLSDLWTALFDQLKIKLLYFTIYHSQIDETSERTNQTLKIVLRYHLMCLKNSKNWFTVLNSMQREFNNTFSSTTTKTFNEICYDFTSCTSTDLINSFSIISNKILTRQTVQNSIAFFQVMFKHYYDKRHSNHLFKIDDWVLLKLHKNYNISSTKILKKKLSQQYVESFKITEKIDNLIFRLTISEHWKIHSVISITQLKFFESSFATDSSSSSIFMKEDTDSIKSFEIKKIISKKLTKKRDIKYLVRWLKYDFEKNVWRSISKLDNVMNLVKDYELTNNQLSSTQQIKSRKRSKKF